MTLRTKLLLTLVVVAVWWVCGCTHPLTNEQIIAECNKCKAAGLTPHVLANGLSDDRVFAVECRP